MYDEPGSTVAAAESVAAAAPSGSHWAAALQRCSASSRRGGWQLRVASFAAGRSTATMNT